MHMRTCTPAIALIVFALAQGCAVRNSLTIDGTGSLAAMPEGPCAVLSMACRPDADPRSGQTTWGVIDTLNADECFAEMLAVDAARYGGLNIIHPFDVVERLQDAELEFTFDPTQEELAQYTEALGCASYLTGEVRTWQYRYIFIHNTAELDCTIACRSAGTGELLWKVDVHAQARRKSDRELAHSALRSVFEWLKNPPEPSASGGSEAD